MERDLFAEIGYTPAPQNEQNDAPRDLFAEIGYDPQATNQPPRRVDYRRGRAKPEDAPSVASGRSGRTDAGITQQPTDTFGKVYEYANRNALTALGMPGLGLQLIKNTIDDRAASGAAQADMARDDGILDRAGSLLESGYNSAMGGMHRFMGTISGSDVVLDAARKAEAAGGTEIAGTTSWEDVKAANGVIDTASAALKFGAETGIQSLPEMALMAVPYVGLGAEAAIQTGRIGQQRAQNDGRADASGADLAVAAPFALGSAALEKVGFKGVTGTIASKIGGKAAGTAAGRVATATATEAGTEFLQEGIEYAGGSVGTKQGFDAGQMLEQGLAGAIGGGVMGGTLGGVREVGSAAIKRINRAPTPGLREQAGQVAASTITPEDEDSPLDTADIVAGRAELIRADASKAADGVLNNAAMPMVGKRVQITMPDGSTATGVMDDAFTSEDGDGVVVKLDDGRQLREYVDNLADAGVTITELSRTAEADALDAQLRAQAQDAAEPPTPIGAAEPQQSAPPASPPSTGGALTANSDAIDSFMRKTRRAESGGKDNAKNPRSSATGRYQFTNGTWLATYKAEFGKTGESDEQILAKRGDGETQDRLMRRLTSDNANGLAGAGLPVDDGTLYLAHFAGLGGARALLRADPNASAESVLGKAAIDANPFLKGKTAAGVIAWAAGKMGAAPRAGSMVDSTTGAQDVQEREPIDFGEVTPIEDPVRADDGTTEETAGKDVRGPALDAEWVKFADTSGTRNVPRAEMPQIKAEHRGAMTQFLKARGVTHEEVTLPAGDLKPTQTEFSPAKVQQAKDFTGGDRAILVSQDGHVLDGHHQWLAARDKGEDVRAIKLAAPIDELIPLAHEFPSSTIAQESAQDGRPTDTSTMTESKVRIEATPSGKGVAVIGASEAQLAAIAQAAPKAKAVRRKDGAQVYSAKYADAIRAAIAGVEAGATEQAGAPLSDADYEAKARALVIRMIREGNTTAGIQPEGEFSFGQKIIPTQTGPHMTPGKVHVELRDRPGRAFTFNEKQLRDEVARASLTEGADTAEREETALEYDTTDRHERVQWMQAAGVNSAMLVGGAKHNSGTRFDDLPETVQTLLHVYRNRSKQESAARKGLADSTAPEHTTVGVDDRELGEIVSEFNAYQQAMFEGGDEQVTHVFDAPKKGEVVRLADKVKVYHAENGWMTPAEAKAKIDEWKAHARAQGGPGSVNADKIVLSLFDLSGEWSKPWEEAGYQVYRFDIQADPDVGDVNNFSTDFFGDWFGDFDGQDIYAILAACPCTDFASSGARHFAAKDADGRTVASVKLVQQTLATIEYFKPPVWAIENPVGRIEKLGGLPPWRLSFDPNHLGETYTKKTLLWGRFNGDLPIAPVDPVEGSKMHRLYGGKSLATKNARSVTPEGFAYSFFMANNAVDHPAMALANKFDRLDRKAIEAALAAGVTDEQITSAVEDLYYQELDDESANAAIKELTRQRKMGAKKAAPKAKEDPGSKTLRDWRGVEVPAWDEQGARGDYDGGPTKDAFLADGKAYLNAVASILAKDGFAARESAPNRNGKTKTLPAVSVNPGGTAVAGDVYLEVYPEGDGPGVQVQYGMSALNGPKGGASLIARRMTRRDGRNVMGNNNWWPVDLTAQQLADKLKDLIGFEARSSVVTIGNGTMSANDAATLARLSELSIPNGQKEQARRELLDGDDTLAKDLIRINAPKPNLIEAAKASGRLEIVDTRTPTKPEAKRKRGDQNPHVRVGERYTFTQEIPGQYVRANTTYRIENGYPGEAFFRNEETDGATSLPNFAIKRALDTGTMQRIDAEPVSRADELSASRPSEAELSRESWQSDFDAQTSKFGDRLNSVTPDRLRDLLEAMDERGLTLPDGDAIYNTNPHWGVLNGYLELQVDADGQRRIGITEKGRAFVRGEADQEARPQETANPDAEPAPGSNTGQKAAPSKNRLVSDERGEVAFAEPDLPSRSPPRDNYRSDLSEYADTLWRETSMNDLELFIPTGASSDPTTTRSELFFADKPSLALGQGDNAGVLMEFDADGILGQINTGKPAWEFGFTRGMGSEYIARLNSADIYKRNLRAIRINSDAKATKVTRMRLPRFLKALEEAGWTKTTEGDGTQIYSRPDVVPPKPAQLNAGQEPSTAENPEEPTQEALRAAKGSNNPVSPITDFGEVLQGARKDVWQSYRDKMEDAALADIGAVALSKSWPEPDYRKLIEEGADPYTIAWMRAARDEIPTKPSKSWKIKGWVDDVRLLRDMANKLLTGEIDGESVKSRMVSPEFNKRLRDLQGRIDLYMEVGHEKSLKGISLTHHFYSMYRGEKNVEKWAVEKRAKANAFGNWPHELSVADTREEAISNFKALLETGGLDKKASTAIRFDIYSRKGEPGFIIGKKIGKTYVDLKRFETAKDARAFKVTEDGYAELVRELEKFRYIPDERKKVNSPRIGINHRNGGDVTPEAFSEAFGFRGVQFGNYVEDARRQEDLNEAYDALMDLGGILGVPARALSLNGELGLAFGARGKGGKNAASAHFEPDSIVINLTKNKGAGSLAHEWWHGLDNYFSRMRSTGGFMTEGKIVSMDGVRPEMVEAFRDVMLAINQTSLRERSSNLDRRRTKAYWSTNLEMSARAFESYVIAKLQDEQFSNDYLANIVSEDAFAVEGGYPYLKASEIPVVRAAFDNFFKSVEIEETDAGVRLFSIPEAADSDLPIVAELHGREFGKLLPKGRMRIVMLRDRAMSWFGQHLMGRTITASDGEPVAFSRKGMKKTMAGAGDEILRAVPAIEALIAKGVKSDVPTKTGSPMRAVMFAGIVTIDGVPQRMGAIVRIDRNGRRHYDLTNNVREGAAGYPGEPGGGGKASNPAMDSAPSGNWNLVPLDAGFNPETAQAAPTAEDLQARLESYGIARKVALKVVDTLNGAAGDYRNLLVRIATDTAQDAAFTLDHEVVHALRDMGLINASEWAVLAARARRDTALMRSIKRRYPKLDAEGQVEEAVADMFARHQRGDYQAEGTVARVFKRLVQAFEAMRNWLANRGARTAEDVMQGIARGENGGRSGQVLLDGSSRQSRYGLDMSSGAREDRAIAQGFLTEAAWQEMKSAGVRQGGVAEASGSRNQQRGTAGTSGRGSPSSTGAGRLAAFYHGTKGRIEPGFDLDHSNRKDAGWLGRAVYVTDDPLLANAYAAMKRGGEGENVLPLTVRISNPFHATLTDKQRLRHFDQDGVDRWTAALARAGHDSVILTYPDGTTEVAVFDPANVRSKFAGFDPARMGENDLLASIPERADMVDLAGVDPTWRGKMAVAYEKWRTAVQDRYLPLLKVQRQIERATGQALPENRNPYMGEELMTGRIGAALDKLAEDHVAPLFDAMHAEGVSLEELETFVYARHAPERNARMAEINPEFEQGEGSGMTDIEAMAVMNRVRRSGQMPAMERLAARIDALREFTLETQIEAGLISQEQADDMRATYEHYVPLRGFKEVEGDIDPAMADRINRSGGGINVRGKESKRAFGRRSKADSPIAYMILQAESAIVRGETNKVAQKFVNLAKANPNEDFWKVNKVSQRQRINEETGLVERYLTRNMLGEDADWTVSAKFNGVERRVTMNRQNPAARRLADSMRNLTQHQLDFVTLHLGKFNRFLSAVNTTYNPEFVITNAFRDVQTAAFNLSGEDIENLVSAVAKNYKSAFAASVRGAFGKGTGEWGRWYDEFVSEGGRVYFNKLDNIDEIKGRLVKAAESAALKAGEGDARLRAKQVFVTARDYIEGMNNGVENAVRLATYKAAREKGLSKAKAASLAKNVTVNFNRRGTMGPALNAAYLFFNASVQGTARIFMALKSKRVRKMMAGVMVAGLVAELVNAWASDDDDDGESFYDKVPDYEKSRNIILMLPGEGGRYIKIPMPYGYNVFWEAGRTVAEIARRGGARWQDSAGNLISTALDSFNPIGGSDHLLNLISPTITDPIVDLTLNRDFTGKPIMPNQPAYGPEVPDNQRYWGSVGTHWKDITGFLNDATGGDEVVPGAIDVSPETLEYLAGTAIGSAGAFLDRVAGLGFKKLDPEADVTANDLPMARKLFGSKPGWYDKSAFYDRLGMVEQQVSYAKDYLEAENMDAARSFVDDNEAVLTLQGSAKQARKDMRQIRKAKDELEELHDKDRIDDAAYRSERKVLADAEKIVIDRFNGEWNATMKAYGE